MTATLAGYSPYIGTAYQPFTAASLNGFTSTSLLNTGAHSGTAYDPTVYASAAGSNPFSADIEVILSSITPSGSNPGLSFWWIRAPNGTNFATPPGTTDALAPGVPDFFVPALVSVANTRLVLPDIQLPRCKAHLLMRNDLNVAFAGDANSLIKFWISTEQAG